MKQKSYPSLNNLPTTLSTRPVNVVDRVNIQGDPFSKGQEYIREIIQALERKFPGQIASVVLFGSQARQEATKSSDVDLIVILEDNIPKKTLKKLLGHLQWLETRFGYRKSPQGGLVARFIASVETGTGMFTSFACRRSEFLQGDFARIFHINRILAWIAPQKVVLESIRVQGITVYGENLNSKLPPLRITVGQLMKSFLINLLLGAGTLFLAPFSRDSEGEITRQSMEATKWSLFSSYFWLFNETVTINEMVRFALVKLRKGFLRRHFLEFLALRNMKGRNKRFVMRTPVVVFLIHRFFLKYRKLR